MKINKSILTGMTALALFATGAATATSSMTSVTANASAHKHARKTHKHVRKAHKRVRKAHKRVRRTHKKRAVKHVYKYDVLIKAESANYAPHFFYAPATSPKLTFKNATKYGWGMAINPVKGYELQNSNISYVVSKHTKRVYQVGNPYIPDFISDTDAPVNDKTFTRLGFKRMSRAHFKHLFMSMIPIKGIF